MLRVKCPSDEELAAFAEEAPLPSDPLAAHVGACTHCRQIVDSLRSSSDAGEDEPELPEVGERVGRYVMLRRIGSGAMGVVLQAYDPNLDRKVAIKLISASDPEARSRVDREARALARLSHPNSVTVFETGSWRGRELIVMELIDGSNVKEWLAEGSRSWREVLDAYLAAGRGLAAAHAAGIVHRDVKPTNILIGRDGRARVGDFGLARDHHADALSSTPSPIAGRAHAGLTETGAVIGTPGYMSPEQLRGEPADARSDQFGFAAALFEGLYGERPYDGDSTTELLASISSSTVREPTSRGARVPGAVRRVLLRALSVRPDDRYPSIELLLGDLERAARPRRRPAVMIAAGVLGIGAWLALASDPCPGAEEKLAGLWDSEVRAGWLARRGPSGSGEAARVAAILDRYRADFLDGHRDACLDTRRGEQSAELLDRRMLCLSNRLAELRALVASAESAKLAELITAALALGSIEACGDVERLLSTRALPRDPQARARIEALGAQIAEARVLQRLGRAREAHAQVSAVAQAARSIDDAILAEALVVRGNLEDDLGELEASEKTLAEATELAARVKDDRLASEAWKLLLWVIGISRRHLPEAEQIERAARAAQLRAGDPPGDRAHLYNTIATMWWLIGKNQEARRLHEEALAIRRALPKPDAIDIAATLSNLGLVLDELGEKELARARFEEALAIWEAQLGPNHPKVAIGLSHLGDLSWERGDHARARPFYERALAIREAAYGPDHPEVAQALNNIGDLLWPLGELDAARAGYERALAIYERTFGVEDSRVATTHENLGHVALARGDHAEARRRYLRSLEIRTKTDGEEHGWTVSVYQALGKLAETERRAEEAVKWYQRALEVIEKARGTDHPSWAPAQADLERAQKLQPVTRSPARAPN